MIRLSRSLIIVFSLLFCNMASISQVALDGKNLELAGNWYSISNPSIRYVFLPSGACALINGSDTLFGGHDFPVRYFLKEDEGRLLLDYREHNSGDLLTRAKLQFQGTDLIFAFLKEGADKQQYFDEIGVFSKYPISMKHLKMDGGKDKFIIPEGYRGFVFVAYNQPEAKDNSSYRGLTRVFQISSKGLVSTTLPEDLPNIAFKHFCFYNNLSNDANELHLPVYDRAQIQVLKEKAANTFTDSQLNQPCFLVLGYNQSPRSTINRLFGRQVEGNVAVFRIDTLKNLLQSDLYKTSN